jgi:hypothetical protein
MAGIRRANHQALIVPAPEWSCTADDLVGRNRINPMLSSLFQYYWDFNHPATLVVLAPLFLWFFLPQGNRVPATGAGWWRRGFSDGRRWSIFDAAIISLSVAHGVFYLAVPNFADYGEAVMPLLAGNYLQSAPIYSDWTLGHAIVGSNYGPYVFLAQIPALLLLPTIAASKFVGVAGGFGAIVLLYVAVRNHRSVANALATCAIMIGLLSFELHYWFWNRPDSLLLAIVSLGVLLFDRTRPVVCLVALAFLAGISANLKLFAPVYLVPLAVACVVAMGSWRELLGAVVIGAVLFLLALALPFLGGVSSLTAYLANLAMMPKQGFMPDAAYDALFYALAILLLPLGAAHAFGAETRERAMMLALAACTFAVMLAAGKPGGGPPYMMPFVPAALYLASRLSAKAPDSTWEDFTRFRRLVACVMIACAAPMWAYSWYQMARQIPTYRTELAKAAELRSLFERIPLAEMGHNSGDDAAEDEFFRVERAFLGQAVRFDFVNFADQRAAGLPASVIYPLFDRCSVPSWILPRGGEVFGGASYGVPMLDQQARDRFHATYELTRTYAFYEVWSCRSESGG